MARDISMHFFLNPPPIKGFRPKHSLGMNLFSCGTYFALLWTEPKKRRGIQSLKRKANYYLDFRGSITSISLLKLIQTFREMKPDEVLEILGSNLDTRSDLFKVLPDGGYELIFLDILEEGDYLYRIQLKKKS